jgi:hypothetical protein
MQVKETRNNPRPGDGTPGPGRPKGVPNKSTALLKDAILKAGEIAGGGETRWPRKLSRRTGEAEPRTIHDVAGQGVADASRG